MTSSVEGSVVVIARLERELAEKEATIIRLTAALTSRAGTDPRWTDSIARRGDYCRKCHGAPTEGMAVRLLTTADRRTIVHVVCPEPEPVT